MSPGKPLDMPRSARRAELENVCPSAAHWNDHDCTLGHAATSEGIDTLLSPRSPKTTWARGYLVATRTWTEATRVTFSEFANSSRFTVSSVSALRWQIASCSAKTNAGSRGLGRDRPSAPGVAEGVAGPAACPVRRDAEYGTGPHLRLPPRARPGRPTPLCETRVDADTLG